MLSKVACGCCGDLDHKSFAPVSDRRGFLRYAGATAALGLLPNVAWGAEGNYEAMVLSCIDPRLQEPVRDYLAGRQLTGKYSQFVIAGSAIGVTHPAFKDWHKAFWDNLGTSIQLHKIKKVIAITHRDCGAARIAFGADKVVTAAAETETHRVALADFRKQVAERLPSLSVETGLMALDGKIEIFA